MSKQQFDREKFKDAVHYVVANTRQDELGRVKLHKTLYFSDMLWFIASGSALTGAEYRKQQFGPCATFLARALTELEQEGRVRQNREWYFGYEKYQYTALRAASNDRFTDSERAVIDETIAFVCRNNTAKSISELSHTKAWDVAKLGAVMPYYSAVNIVPAEVDEDDINWAKEEAAKIEVQRSRGAPLQRRAYAEFREGLRGDPREVAAGD